MRNLLAFLAAATLTVAGLGWYLDWYRIRSQPAPTGQRSLTIDINTSKIGADIHKGEQGLQKMLENKDKEKDKDSAKGSGQDDRGGVEKNAPGTDGRGGAEKDAPGKGVKPGGAKSAPAKNARPTVEPGAFDDRKRP
jgi:hypothetical protein